MPKKLSPSMTLWLVGETIIVLANGFPKFLQDTMHRRALAIQHEAVMPPDHASPLPGDEPG